VENPIKVGQSRTIAPNFGAGVETFSSSKPSLVTVNSSTGVAKCILDVATQTPVFIRGSDGFGTVIETYRLDVVPSALDLTAFNATFPSSPGVANAVLSGLSISSFARLNGQSTGASNTVNGSAAATVYVNPQALIYNAKYDIVVVSDLQGQALRKITPAGVSSSLSTTSQYGPALTTDGVDRIFYHSQAGFRDQIFYEYNLATQTERIVAEITTAALPNSIADGMTYGGGKIYFGIYGDTRIFSIDVASGTLATVPSLVVDYSSTQSIIYLGGYLFWGQGSSIYQYNIATHVTSTYGVVTGATSIDDLVLDPIAGTIYAVDHAASTNAVYDVSASASGVLIYRGADFRFNRGLAVDKNRKAYALIVNSGTLIGLAKSA
jgi:hypothetical protein